jgi:hypothetical protein
VREAWASAREFGRKIIRHFIAVAVGVFGGILGIVDAVSAAAAKPKTTPFSIPLWVWLSLLAGGFLVAIFRAFHDVRMERDAAKAEVKRRDGALRYALSFDSTIASDTHVRRPGVGDVVVIFQLQNNSPDEYLRYEYEEVTVLIEGKESAESEVGTPKGGVLAPGAIARHGCPPVRDVPLAWQTGSLRLTVKYGHPSAPLQYRKSWEYKLWQARLAGSRPGQGMQLFGELVSSPEVEDIV